MGTADIPLLALTVGFENEGAFARSDQYSHLAHASSLELKNLGNSGVESCSRQRRCASARNSSRRFSILSIAAQGAFVSSCRAAHISRSKRTGARSMPFLVKR